MMFADAVTSPEPTNVCGAHVQDLIHVTKTVCSRANQQDVMREWWTGVVMCRLLMIPTLFMLSQGNAAVEYALYKLEWSDILPYIFSSLVLSLGAAERCMAAHSGAPYMCSVVYSISTLAVRVLLLREYSWTTTPILYNMLPQRASERKPPICGISVHIATSTLHRTERIQS